MNKPLKKLLICGASLLMMASLGTGLSNVSAKRVHHYRPRTHKVYKSHKRVNKRTAQYTNIMKYLRWVKKYDAKHSKPYKSWKLRHLNKYAKGLSRYQRTNVYKFAKSLSSVKPKVRVRKFHRAKNNKRARKSSHYTKQQSMTNTRRRNHKAKRVATKRDVRKHSRKSNQVAKSKKSTTPSSVASNTQNTMSSTKSSTDTPVAHHYNSNADQTDGGKYYNWDQLQNVLNSYDVVCGTESKATDDKIKNTLYYNLTKWNYSNKQLNELQNDSYIQQYDPYMMASANAEESINNLP